MNADATSYTISTDKLTEGHKYRFAVGAYSSDVNQSWTTVEFSVVKKDRTIETQEIVNLDGSYRFICTTDDSPQSVVLLFKKDNGTYMTKEEALADNKFVLSKNSSGYYGLKMNFYQGGKRSFKYCLTFEDETVLTSEKTLNIYSPYNISVDNNNNNIITVTSEKGIPKEVELCVYINGNWVATRKASSSVVPNNINKLISSLSKVELPISIANKTNGKYIVYMTASVNGAYVGESNHVEFEINRNLAVSSLYPSVVTKNDNMITINGDGLRNATVCAVINGEEHALNISKATNTQIVANIPDSFDNLIAEAQSVEIKVTEGNKTASASVQFEKREETTKLESCYESKHSAEYKSGKYYTALRNVDITGNYVEDLVSVALSQNGYYEGKNSEDLSGNNEYGEHNNHTEYYNNTYCKLAASWCAAFVTWCARESGIPDEVIPKFENCPTGYKILVEKLKAKKVEKPQKGDLVFYYCPHCKSYTHVGIVYDDMKSIEGNTTNGGTKVDTKDLRTNKHPHKVTKGDPHNTECIKVYVRPNYSGANGAALLSLFSAEDEYYEYSTDEEIQVNVTNTEIDAENKALLIHLDKKIYMEIPYYCIETTVDGEKFSLTKKDIVTFDKNAIIIYPENFDLYKEAENITINVEVPYSIVEGEFGSTCFAAVIDNTQFNSGKWIGCAATDNNVIELTLSNNAVVKAGNIEVLNSQNKNIEFTASSKENKVIITLTGDNSKGVYVKADKNVFANNPPSENFVSELITFDEFKLITGKVKISNVELCANILSLDFDETVELSTAKIRENVFYKYPDEDNYTSLTDEDKIIISDNTVIITLAKHRSLGTICVKIKGELIGDSADTVISDVEHFEKPSASMQETLYQITKAEFNENLLDVTVNNKSIYTETVTLRLDILSGNEVLHTYTKDVKIDADSSVEYSFDNITDLPEDAKCVLTLWVDYGSEPVLISTQYVELPENANNDDKLPIRLENAKRIDNGVKVNIVNSTSEEIKSDVYVAIYDKPTNALKEIKSEKLTINGNDNIEYTKDITADMDNSIIKIFVWKENTMSPLCNVQSVEN